MIWKGKKNDEAYQEDLTVQSVISEFLVKNDSDELVELASYHLVMLSDPAKGLDLSKTLKDNNVKDNSYLLLTKRLHLQTFTDVRTASILALYTIVIFALAMWALFSLWPTNAHELLLNDTRVGTLAWTSVKYSLGPEILLILVIALSGVIGACIYSLYAISLHLGAVHDFDQRWSAWYVLRPFLGAGLAVVIILLVRSNLLAVGTGSDVALNIVGNTGVGAITGVFSEHAVRKLHKVADTLYGGDGESNSQENNVNLG